MSGESWLTGWGNVHSCPRRGVVFEHMFDAEPFDEADEAYYARRAAALDLIDEWEVVGAEPPQAEPEPSDAEVCAEAAQRSTMLGPARLARLDAVDLDELAGEAAVDAAAAFDRVANRIAARRARAIARAAVQHVGTERVDPIRLAAAELGPVLRLGSGSIDAEIDVALSLTSRLTVTLAAMESGAVSYGKAKVLADETADLFDEQARAVEALVLDRAAGRTWAQHAAAVRRAVVRVDPTAPERRRKNAERASRLVRRYGNDGLADLIVTLPVAQVDAAYTGADAWARARKAAGDDRPLEQLRAEAFTRWASSYLTHGDPTTCDRHCDPVETPQPPTDATPDGGSDVVPAGVDPDTGQITDPVESSQAAESDDRPGSRRTPTRHGRPLRVGLIWHLPGLLGLVDSPGELLDSGEVISPADMRTLVAGGIRLRRLLVDPDTGELVDLTPGSWLLPPETTATSPDAAAPAHGQPMWLGVVVDVTTWQAWRDRSLTGLLATAITLAPRAVRDLMDAPRTDATLDQRPDADAPSAALGEFVAIRDRHPANPTAAPTAAAAGDLDHVTARGRGGPTTRGNLHSPSRRWHVLRTHGGWRLHAHRDGGWIWTSPQGRTYRTRPHDYRRGP
jgi:hypothetical protein